MEYNDNGCNHGVSWDSECEKCNSEIVEAKSAGAITPNEIGIYFRGKKAGGG